MHAAVRCGLPHYDHLLDCLDALQLHDLLLYHGKYNLSIGREDLMQALARRDFIAVNLPEDEFPPRLCEVSPYIPDPLDTDESDEEIEAVRQRLMRPIGGGQVQALPAPGE